MEQKLKTQLKAKAHSLKPVVLMGEKGLTENVQLEIERALLAHELIKIRVTAETKEERQQMIQEVCEKRGAECVGSVGHIAIIYRKNEE
jgi:RNA-binding protein